MKPLFLSLLLLLSWVFQCNDQTISDDRGSLIYGTVTDSATNLPLEAWVGSDSVLDTTVGLFFFADSTGYYTYPTLSSGGQLYCGMEEYYTQMKEYQVAWGGSTAVNFGLISR